MPNKLVFFSNGTSLSEQRLDRRPGLASAETMSPGLPAGRNL